ncbi:MAG: hypothetical protein DI588_09160 [Flavobacterium johnsoniae]|nr:MAG: hypothetical protein DI588_09160 [Flavobacterium johnsoniae]
MKLKLTQNQTLIILLILSLIIVICNEILFYNVPEIIPYGDVVGQVFSYLSLSYIASCIFYYVVVVVKEKRDKKNVYLSVYKLLEKLIAEAYAIYRFPIEASKTDRNKFTAQTITREEYIDVCSKANPREISPQHKLGMYPNLRDSTYGQLIKHGSVDRVIFWTEKIFVYMPYLDSDLVKLIDELTNNKHHHFGEFLPLIAEPNFSKSANDMFEFLEKVRSLEEYNNTVVKKIIS